MVPLDPAIVYSVYRSNTKAILKLMNQKLPILETTQVCYVVDLKQDRTMITSGRPFSFISSPSPNHVIKTLKSSFVLFEMQANAVSFSAFTEIEMRMKSFEGTFKLDLATALGTDVSCHFKL